MGRGTVLLAVALLATAALIVGGVYASRAYNSVVDNSLCTSSAKAVQNAWELFLLLGGSIATAAVIFVVRCHHLILCVTQIAGVLIVGALLAVLLALATAYCKAEYAAGLWVSATLFVLASIVELCNPAKHPRTYSFGDERP